MRKLERVELFIASIALLFMIGLTLTTFSLENFTREENLKPIVVNAQLIETDTSQYESLHAIHKRNCEGRETSQTISLEGREVSILCSDILASTSKDYARLIIERVAFPQLYEKNYPCTFLQCLTKMETVQVIYSRQGNDFLNSTRFFLIFGTLILVLLVAVLSGTISGAVLNLGILFLVTGVNFFLEKLIPLGGALFDSAEATELLFSPIRIPLLVFLILGVIGILVGLYMKKKEKL